MATTNVNLYRSLHKSDWPDSTALIVNDVPVNGILYPDFEKKKLPNGKSRRPDVELTIVDGATHVKSRGGTSLWDKDGVLKGQWRTFTIPQGTPIPEPLKLKKSDFDEARNATHYQIEVAMGTLEINAFKGALDNFARAAVARSVELAKGSAK